MRRLPSLTGLKAFEAAARHESFTRAAEELCVTQGAVSHKVKALEEELGLKLFIREPQRLKLSDVGREYLTTIRHAFDMIADGTDKLHQQQSSGILTVTTSPNFAAKWLVYRLGQFAESHPEIDLRISASRQHIDFAREDVDMAIRHGDGRNLEGLDAIQLYREELFPVCSPNLNLREPSDLSTVALLHLDNRNDWAKWLEAAGVGDMDRSGGLVMNQASMIIDAAVNGQGVALARTGLAAQDLLQGRLIRPFDLSLSVTYSYWIVCPKASTNLPKIITFRNWLLAEAQAEKEKLDSLLTS